MKPANVAVTEYGLTGREAVDLARMHHQWLPETVSIEQTGGPADSVLEALRAMGHTVRAIKTQGDAESIWIAADGTPYGVNDARSEDSKASPANLTAAAARR